MPAAPRSQIAAQLYTLRDLCKTPADIAATLKKVRKIGYEAVQVSGIGKIDPKELKMILDGEGLACCATHIGLDRMKNEPQAVLDEHHLWGCTYTAIGHFNANTAKGWVDFAKDVSDAATKLKAGGLEVGYHNHSHEFIRHDDGRSAFQIMLDECGKDVWFEIDTYWITHGGGDPMQWINKVAGRIPCVHFKDMGIDSEKKQVMKEVGEGNLNWPGIIETSRKAGVQWYIVEQDNCNGRDPLESIAQSLTNLRSLGIH